MPKARPTKPAVQDSDFAALVATFEMLGDQTRVRLLHLLLDEGERNVTSLTAAMDLPQPTISHHLALLRSANMVSTRRLGKEVYYEVSHRVRREADGTFRIDADGMSVRIGTAERRS